MEDLTGKLWLSFMSYWGKSDHKILGVLCMRSPMKSLPVPLPDNLILSSKVALKAPGGLGTPFLIWPRRPLTVRKLLPSNFATSSWLLNMPYSRKNQNEIVQPNIKTMPEHNQASNLDSNDPITSAMWTYYDSSLALACAKSQPQQTTISLQRSHTFTRCGLWALEPFLKWIADIRGPNLADLIKFQ